MKIEKHSEYLISSKLLVACVAVMVMLGAVAVWHIDKVMRINTKYTEDTLQQICDIRLEINDLRRDIDNIGTLYLESLGEFEITHYCACQKCCGKSPDGPNYGITATGTQAQANHTIAVDPKLIPYGTHLLIDGIEYVAEDCGGGVKGKRLDIYCDTHEEALNRGRITRIVDVVINK